MDPTDLRNVLSTLAAATRIPLRVLLVDDSPVDVELVVEELRYRGYEPTWERVDTATALRAALAQQEWDVITCDWVMPQFSAPAALALLREFQVDVPTIIVSGQVGEEYAVTAMKAGAHDFISKRNLARLCPAIERELRETEARRAQKRAEEMLRRSEDKFRLIFNSTHDAVFVLDLDGQFLEVNQAMCDHVRYTREELLKLTVRDISTAEFAAQVGARLRKILQDSYAVFETACIRRDGTLVPVEASARTIEYEGKPAILSVGRDITERKRAEERVRMFSQDIIAAREEERKQVSSVLHHDMGSLAVGISAHLDAIEGDLRSGKPGEALKWTKRTRKLFSESVARLKEVAVQLRPPELDTVGLCGALRQHFSQVTKHGATRIHFRDTLGPRRVSGDTATTLFRVAQETLTNAIRHGHAKQVYVYLSASKKEVRLTVRDNGKGFSPREQPAQATSRMGLGVMQEMVVSARGGFAIDSRPREGTTVRVSLPVTTAALGPGDVTVRNETVARRKTTRSAGRGSRPQKGSGA